MILRKTSSRVVVILQLYNFKIESHRETLAKQVSSYMQFLATAAGSEIAVDLGFIESVDCKPNFAKEFALQLCESVIHNKEKIMSCLAHEINNYSDGQLNPTCKALLEVAVAEHILAITPTKVIVDEYTTIAESVLGPNEVGFVNSILDKIVSPYNNYNNLH